MMQSSMPVARAGQTDVPQGAEHIYTLVMLVDDRPGSVDRIVGLMRRRRANMQTLVMGPSMLPDVVRMTVMVTDSQVGIHQLVEQVRKVVDVQQADCFTSEQTVTRELALIKVSKSAANFNDIIACGLLFEAHTVDVTRETVTLEIAGSVENVEKLAERLQDYGIREIARSGRVVISRGTEATQG